MRCHSLPGFSRRTPQITLGIGQAKRRPIVPGPIEQTLGFFGFDPVGRAAGKGPRHQEQSSCRRFHLLERAFQMDNKTPTTGSDAGKQIQPRRHDARQMKRRMPPTRHCVTLSQFEQSLGACLLRLAKADSEATHEGIWSHSHRSDRVIFCRPRIHAGPIHRCGPTCLRSDDAFARNRLRPASAKHTAPPCSHLIVVYRGDPGCRRQRDRRRDCELGEKSVLG
jgi:hypothetical protein